MKNDRLLRHYVDCLLGKAKCPKEGEELKSKNTVFNYFLMTFNFEHFENISTDMKYIIIMVLHIYCK